MHKLFDLKFTIGLFFIVIGLLLLIYGFKTGTFINKLCGSLFSLFALIMLIPFNKHKAS